MFSLLSTSVRLAARRVVLPFLAAAPLAHAAIAQQLPDSLTNEEFWRLVSDFSEPSGFFRSENFVGNENSLQHAIPTLVSRVKPGGVYMGVAPDQNFTLLVALQPKLAFIVDIRRQNLIQHLMYKAVIELSPTRADFVALLFSVAKPAVLDTLATVGTLTQAVEQVLPSPALFEQNFRAISTHLTRTRGFTLSDDDVNTLRYVYGAFYDAGPHITYNYPNSASGRGGRGMPSYLTMMLEWDRSGVQRSYLASESNYRVLREMQLANRIVPLVGDFAGPKAIRSVGEYVRSRGGRVTAFYTSNVEQYLWQQPDAWSRFYSNVATLPTDSTSTLIRSAPNNTAGATTVNGFPGPRSTMLLSYIRDIVSAHAAGRLHSYADVLGLSR